jgi:hypothetical protein
MPRALQFMCAPKCCAVSTTLLTSNPDTGQDHHHKQEPPTEVRGSKPRDKTLGGVTLFYSFISACIILATVACAISCDSIVLIFVRTLFT